MSKIILVNPPLTVRERYGDLASGGSLLPPLGLASLAAWIRESGFKVEIVDAAALNFSVDQAAAEIIRRSPDVIGLTAATTAITNAADLARVLKEVKPKTPILLGGAHLASAPIETFERYPWFDIGVVGEGETSSIELLKALEDRADYSPIKGIVFRDDGEIIQTEKQQYFKDLDSLPLPAWDLLPDLAKSYRPAAHNFARLPSSSIVTSRGCPGKCTFCDRSIFGNRCRSFSSSYLLEEVKVLVERYGVRDISIQDDTFVFFRKRVEEFCQSLLESDIDLVWSCHARVDYVQPELLQLMKRAGCWQIAYGIESGSQDILDSLKKGITLEKIKEAIDWTKQAGIQTRGFFMMGVPGETRETIRQTIDFSKSIALDDFQLSLYTPYPGSELTEVAKHTGWLESDWRKYNGWFVVYLPEGLTKEELQYYQKLAFKEFYLRPKQIWRYLKRIRNPLAFLKIVKGGFSIIKSSIKSRLDIIGNRDFK